MRRFAGDRWQDHGLVFRPRSARRSKSATSRRFQKVCESVGLPRLRLYDLRHTHASLLIHEGVHPKRISERLGHSSIKLTMDTYGHLFDGADQESAAKMETCSGRIDGWCRSHRVRHHDSVSSFSPCRHLLSSVPST